LQAHLTPQDLSDTFSRYLLEANRLKDLQKDRITLLVGLETEYIDSAGLVKLEQLLSTHSASLDYIVGSVHHCDELPIDFDQPRFDEVLSLQEGQEQKEKFGKLFSKYFDNQHELIDRLRPEVVGHFDLCRLYYPELNFKQYPEVWEKIQRNIELAVSYGALFELNASAFRKGWKTGYPGVEIFDVSYFTSSSRLFANAYSSECIRLFSRREVDSLYQTILTVLKQLVYITIKLTSISRSGKFRNFGN
jgi:histidinol-phosphatase (PHP family)